MVTTSSTSGSLPGFTALAVGLDQPMEMLLACHDRVRRSLDLLQRLLEHVTRKGHDRQSRDAAADVLRYFDLAASLHHEDEELHLFPLLLREGDADEVALVHRLQDDHRRMTALWQRLREDLLDWRDAVAPSPPDAGLARRIADFRALYDAHLVPEEGRLFTAGRRLLDAAAVAAMSEDMRRRRGG